MSWRETLEGKIYFYGKELAARATHANSRRTVRAFVAIDYAAFSENLLEAEIFGCEKGAFTGTVTASEIWSYGDGRYRDAVSRRRVYRSGSRQSCCAPFSDRPNEVRVCQLLQLLCDSSLIDRLRGVRAPFRFLHLRS